MKEIHAYKNDDGTYRVEVFGVTSSETMFGKSTIKETTEFRMEIPRALVNITSLPSSSEDEDKYFTITIE